MMKYEIEVGGRYVVREGSADDFGYGRGFIFSGKVVTVCEVDGDWIVLKEDNLRWKWSASILSHPYEPMGLSVNGSAIDTKGRHCIILAIAGGYALCQYEDTPGQKHPVRAVSLNKLKAAPESITIKIFKDRAVTINQNTLDFWGTTVTRPELKKIADAVAKIDKL